MLLKDTIQQFAQSQGAQLVGIAPVEIYKEYVAEVEKRVQETGVQREDYLLPTAPVTNYSGQVISEQGGFFTHLSDARNALPDVKSIILIGVYVYDHAAVYRHTWQELRGKTARTYSYFPVDRQITEWVAALIEEQGYRAVAGQHIPLKFVADRIGLGIYGKNGIFQTTSYGSYVAIRNVLTDAELAPDRFEKIATPCADCERCLHACPTGALYAPYKVNPALCINPISRREALIESHIRSKMQNWIHGCDICQEVCPSNQHLHPRDVDPRARFDSRHHTSHKHLDGLKKTPTLISLLAAQWPDIIRRNAAIALANIGKGRKEAVAALEKQLDSAPSELKEYFMWALNTLESPGRQIL